MSQTTSAALSASLDDIASWPGDASGKALLFSASLNDAFVEALEVLVSVWKSRSPHLCDYKEQLKTLTTRVRAFVTALLHCKECVLMKFSRKSSKMLSNSMVEPSRYQESMLANETAKTIRLRALKSITDGRCTFKYLDVCLEQLRERFTAHSATAYGLSILLPACVIDADI